MNKLNNKGMTLIELIVSVALISILMIFMYKLISDVKYEKKENDKITDNLIKISEIEVTVQEFLLSRDIYRISVSNSSINFYSILDSNLASLRFNDDGSLNFHIRTPSQTTKWTFSDLYDKSICYEAQEDYETINIKIYLKSNDKNIYTIEIPYFNPELSSVSGTTCDSL